MSEAWKETAAQMIEAKKVHLDTNSSEDDLFAAEFIFDTGVLMWPKHQQLEAIAILRKPTSKAPPQ